MPRRADRRANRQRSIPAGCDRRDTIHVATDCPSFFHTMVPAFVVGEILAALVAGRSGAKALDALKHTEQQLTAFNVHWTPGNGKIMTRILHRQIHNPYPTAVGGKGIELIDAQGRRYIDASGGAAVSCLGHGHPDMSAPRCTRSSTSSPMRIPASSRPKRPRSWPTADRGRARRHQPCLFRQRRLGSDRGGAEDGAAVFRREGRAAAPPYHRAPAELSRQYARRARDRRQRLAARAVRAAADRDAPHRSRASPIASARQARATPLTRRAPRRRWRTRSSSLAPIP